MGINLKLNLKTREIVMVAAAAAVVLYFFADFLLLRPLEKEIKGRQSRLKEVEEKITGATNSIPELMALRGRVEEKNRIFQLSGGKVVGQEQIRVFLNQLAAESSRLKLEIQTVSLSPESQAAGGKSGSGGAGAEKTSETPREGAFKQVPAQVTLTGPYEGIREYLVRVQRLPLFMELDQIQIQGEKEGKTGVRLSFRPTFFMRAESP